MKKTVWIGFCCLAVLQWASFAAANGIERSGVNIEETIDCQGQPFKIEGSSNHITLLGTCPELKISGTSNVIRVERVGNIRINGTSNQVLWKQVISGRIPDVSNDGVDNKVEQEGMEADHHDRHEGDLNGRREDRHEERHEEAQEQDNDINISGDGISRTVVCHGEDVNISGNKNRVRLRGECGQVSVDGNKNNVQIDAVSAISVEGFSNTVTWKRSADGEEPQISDEGHHDKIRRVR